MTKKIVSVLDPALDLGQMDVRAYADGGSRDEAAIRELPGRTAARFHIRHLSVEESLACDSQPTLVHKIRLAVCYALERVDRGSGNVMLPSGARKEGLRKKLYWLDHEYAQLVQAFGKLVLSEIGMAIAEMDEALGEAFRDDAAERYTLLPSSRDALAQRERRHAASIQNGPTTQNSDE